MVQTRLEKSLEAPSTRFSWEGEAATFTPPSFKVRPSKQSADADGSHSEERASYWQLTRCRLFRGLSAESVTV